MKEGTQIDISQDLGPYRIYGTVKKLYGVLVIEVDKNYYISTCLNVTAEKKASSRGDDETGWIVSYGREASNTIHYKNTALKLMDEISETQYKRTKVQVSIPNEEIVVKFRT